MSGAPTARSPADCARPHRLLTLRLRPRRQQPPQPPAEPASSPSDSFHSLLTVLLLDACMLLSALSEGLPNSHKL